MAALRIVADANAGDPRVSWNLGNELQKLGRFTEAEACYRSSLRLKPDYPEAHFMLGNTLFALGRLEESEACYRAVLALGESPDVYNNLGNVLQKLDRFIEAQVCYRSSLRLDPDYPKAHYNLGSTFLYQNKPDEAAECYERALVLKPDYGAARFGLCMAQLPVLYEDEPEMDRRRAAYENCLRRLSDDVTRGAPFPDLATGVGAHQPFYLAYQGYNDRELQSLYGSLVCRIMAGTYPPAPLTGPPVPGEKVRVGVVSGLFHQHTVWRLMIEGWLNRLDRRRFEVFGYYTGTGQDDKTRYAAALCSRFVQGRLPGHRWRETILSDAPHVLLYPEVGMDPMSAQLAAQRLAPTQCLAWGHPDTSGFPTMDYFLSSRLMEPPDGQNHYTERLVLLPNLSIYYEPGDDCAPAPAGRPKFGFRPASTVFWCGQALYKYHPRFDRVFPRIAERVGDCRFVFIEYPKDRHVTDLFLKRLDRAFASSGLDARDFCVVLPPMEHGRFLAAIGACDIVLDSIGWSGGLSTLDCLTRDLPIVTLAGPLMRGRHTAAILERIGAAETVTHTVDDYVSTAVRLAGDIPWRTAIGRKISENKHLVYRDQTAISALEEFLDSVARRQC